MTMIVNVPPPRKKLTGRKVCLILLWQLTALAIPITGAIYMYKSTDHFMVNNYEISTCVLQTSTIEEKRFGYTTVWLENSTGCSILQSPLSWYDDLHSAKAQRSIYPLNEELPCWCNWRDFYEYPLVSDTGYDYELVTTCYLDPVIMTYMSDMTVFFTIGKIVFWIGMALVFASSVSLVMCLLKPISDQQDPTERSKLLQ
jgi:hypothetical protein